MDRDYVVERYRTRDGKVPFEEWVAKMKRKDPELVFRILLRIDRARKGISAITGISEMVSGN
jgi:hypothetical protein